MKSIRLVILNTWKCEGEYHQRLRLITEELLALDPDIVALQESFLSVDGRWNTARDIAESLQMEFILLSNRRKKRTMGSQVLDSYNGLSILTRLPIKESWEFELSKFPEDGDRSALLAVFDCCQSEFILANLHLTHIPNRDEARTRQLSELIGHCKQLKRNVVLCGDFNSPLRNLNRAGLLAPKGELRDTWELAGGSQPKPVTLHAAHRSVGTEFEHGSIDHIMYLEQASPKLSFSHPDRVFEKGDQFFGILPSDHMGLSITISISS
jgi:endonuclease/exonuclease/phosphatase family metal-dependent hydrolase